MKIPASKQVRDNCLIRPTLIRRLFLFNKHNGFYLQHTLVQGSTGCLKSDISHLTGTTHDEYFHGARNLLSIEDRRVDNFPAL